MAAIAIANRSEIKTAVGIGIAKNASPIMILRRFLEQIGYGTKCIRCERIRKKRVRVYQTVEPKDGREQVFKQWLTADRRHPGSSELWLDDYAFPVDCMTRLGDSSEVKYVQLSLSF